MRTLKKLSFLAPVFVVLTFVIMPVSVSYGQALPPAVSRPPVSSPAVPPVKPAATTLPGGVCTGPSTDTNNPCFNYDKSATYTLLEPLPCISSPAVTDASGKVIQPAITCNNPQITKVDFATYVQYMFNLLIALAAVTAVFMIVWGGFQYMSADSFQNKSDGLKKLENAIYGLLLVLCSFLILRTIDPRLVNIPSTLVKPLDIKYQPDELSAFFAQLNSDAENFKKATTELRHNNNKIQELIDAKKIQQDALCSKLISENTTGPINIGPYKDECHAIMAQLSTLSPEAQALVAQIANLDNQQTTLKTQMVVNTAIGTMNIQIQACYNIGTAATGGYGINSSAAGCLNDIATTQSAYIKKLSDAGATVEAQKIKDYGTYATSIAKINTVILTNMSSSPDAKAFVDTLQTAVTVVATAAGSVYGGGVVGGVAGFAGAQVFNGVVFGAPIAESNSAAAKETISYIQQEVNYNLNQIKDQEIKDQYQTQAYTLIKKLGGKGDGKDLVSVPPANNPKATGYNP